MMAVGGKYVVVPIILYFGILFQCVLSDYNPVPLGHPSPLGLQTVGKKTYWVGDKQKESHAEALASCLRYGMELVNINNREKESVVRNLIQNSRGSSQAFWTSGNKLNDHDVWVWSRGVPITYFHWAPGEPNNQRKTEYCMEYTNGHFNDHVCNQQNYFVCESIDTASPNTSIVPLPHTMQPTPLEQLIYHNQGQHSRKTIN